MVRDAHPSARIHAVGLLAVMGAGWIRGDQVTAAARGARITRERPLWKAALLAVVLAGIGNATLYFICYVAGIIPWSMLSPGRGVSLTPQLVLTVSVGGVLAGTAIYAALLRTSPNPDTTFRWLALIIVILSFGAPLWMQLFTWDLMLALDLMHVVVAAATVWCLTVWREPKTS